MPLEDEHEHAAAEADTVPPRPTAEELGVTADDLLEVIRALPDVIFRCHKAEDGRIYWSLNEGQLAEQFGLTTKEIEGKHLEQLFEGGASDHIRESFQRAFKGEPHVFVNEMGGRYFKHYPQPVFDEDGNVTELVGYITEVTELKRAQDTVGRQAAEMARLRELEQLTFVTSHNLQEPLRMVRSYVQLLERRYGDLLEGDGAEFLEYVLEGTRRLNALIADLRVYSEVMTRDDPYEEVALQEVVEEVRRGLAHEIAQRDARVEVADLPTVRGDPRQLKELLRHLVQNGLRFADVDPPVIRVTAERGLNNWVVSVEDRGIGIEPGHQERIFELFQRIPMPRQPEGTGLGLTLCKRIVERHGGEIWVDSTPGGGSTFTFTLPHGPHGDVDVERVWGSGKGT